MTTLCEHIPSTSVAVDLRESSVNNNEDNDIQNRHSELDELHMATSTCHFLRRHVLVIVNPESGKGKTVALFQDKVNPILEAGGIKASLFITDHQGHAKSMLKLSEEIAALHGIVVLGGDGLINEVINGLRSRHDSQKYLKIPLGIIAGGSGNGLARSLASYCSEDKDYLRDPILQSTLAIAHGKIIPVNLTEVQLDANKIYSALSVGWGFISDVDIESEGFRGIGEIRFIIWTLICLFKFRTYNAQISFVPYNENSKNVSANDGVGEANVQKNDDGQRVTIDGPFVSVYSLVQPYIGSNISLAPAVQPNDGLIHLLYVRNDIGRLLLAKYILTLDKAVRPDIPGFKSVPTKEFTLKRQAGFIGNLTIDGEKVYGENICVRISPNPLYVFSH